MNMKLVCCLSSFVLAAAMSAAAAPSEYQKFSYDEKAYVPFDATTTVTVECPDSFCPPRTLTVEREIM